MAHYWLNTKSAAGMPLFPSAEDQVPTVNWAHRRVSIMLACFAVMEGESKWITVHADLYLRVTFSYKVRACVCRVFYGKLQFSPMLRGIRLKEMSPPHTTAMS